MLFFLLLQILKLILKRRKLVNMRDKSDKISDNINFKRTD